MRLFKNSGAHCHVTNMLSNWQETHVWPPCFPCQQQNQATLSSQFATSQVLGWEWKTLG